MTSADIQAIIITTIILATLAIVVPWIAHRNRDK